MGSEREGNHNMQNLQGHRDGICNLSVEQIDFYRGNGFLIITSLFTDEECDRIYNIFREHADETFSAILNLDRQEPELRSVMLALKVVSIIETLQGCEAVALATQMLFKEANTGYASQAWVPHQDNAYHQNLNGATLTLNIMCKDADIENGALYAWAGSHKAGLLPFDARVSYKEEMGSNPGNLLEIPVEYKDKRVDLIMKKGDTLVLHGNCIHASYPNISKDRSRPMYSITYITKGEPFAIGNNAKRMAIPLR